MTPSRRTLPAVAADPATAALHAKIVAEDGEARVHEDVWISYAYGNFGTATSHPFIACNQP